MEGKSILCQSVPVLLVQPKLQLLQQEEMRVVKQFVLFINAETE